MPFGLQMIGPLHQDGRLLAMAAAVEKLGLHNSDFARPRPDLAALAQPRPELRSIVTHPPELGGAAQASVGQAV